MSAEQHEAFGKIPDDLEDVNKGDKQKESETEREREGLG